MLLEFTDDMRLRLNELSEARGLAPVQYEGRIVTDYFENENNI